MSTRGCCCAQAVGVHISFRRGAGQALPFGTWQDPMLGPTPARKLHRTLQRGGAALRASHQVWHSLVQAGDLNWCCAGAAAACLQGSRAAAAASEGPASCWCAAERCSLELACSPHWRNMAIGQGDLIGQLRGRQPVAVHVWLRRQALYSHHNRAPVKAISQRLANSPFQMFCRSTAAGGGARCILTMTLSQP